MISRLRFWMKLNEKQKKKQLLDDGHKSQIKTTTLTTLPDTSKDIQHDIMGMETHSQTPCPAQSSDKTVLNSPHNSHTDSLPTRDDDLTCDPSSNHIHNSVKENNSENTPDTFLGQPEEVSKTASVKHVVSGLDMPMVEAINNTFSHMNGDVAKLERSKNDGVLQTVNELSVPQPGDSSVDGDPTAGLQENLTSDTSSKENITPSNRNKDLLNSASDQESHVYKQPEFPLFPMSRGFCLTLQKFLNMYEKALQKMELPKNS